MAALAAVTGCATNAERDEALRASKAALDAKPVCCVQTHQFLFARMAMPFESTFLVDRSAPTYAFPKGKSYFRSFELPPFERPYFLEIESEVMGGSIATSQWLFQPVLLFLDRDHRVVALMRDLRFRPLLMGNQVRGMGMRMLLDERAGSARYLVIFTEPDAMSRTFDFGTVSMSMAAGAPHNRQYSVPYGYEGRLTLRARAGTPAGQ